MRSVRPVLAAWLAACAGSSFAAPEGHLVTTALASRGDRFIEVVRPAQAKRFVNIAASQTMVYGESAIEVRPRGAAPRTLRYEFAAAQRSSPQGLNDSGITYNFLVGARENWLTGLKSYSQVAYRRLWPGIDATYSGDKAGIKYHFDVAPGADPARIAFVVRGAQDGRITQDGAVEWSVGGVLLRDETPVAFQSSGRGDVIVPVAFKIAKLGDEVWELAFEVGAYDRARALTLDPAWTAYTGLVGGNAADQAYAVTRDGAGRTYACGITASTDLPASAGALDTTANGGDDAFVVRLHESGAPDFVTYFGGDGFDVCTGIALHGDGTIFIAGGTTSTNLALVGAPDASLRRSKATTDRDAFVARLNAAGNAIHYSGVIGGTGDDQALAIALDGLGRAHVAGYTRSSTFPVVTGPGVVRSGAMDAFVARVAASGATLEYSGLIGGNGDIEAARGIAVAPDNAAYVVGETDSTTGLPSMAGSFRSVPGIGGTDGFIARISPTGAFQRFTVLTGVATGAQTGIDRALGVAIHADGSLAVVGETDSANFPAGNAGAQQGAAGPQPAPAGNMDGFVLRIAADLSSVISYSYIGGTRFDTAEAVASDFVGDIYVAGTSSNPNGPGGGLNAFPVIPTAGLRTTNLGAQDGFVARLLGSSPNFLGFVGSAASDAMHAISTGTDRILAIGGASTLIAPAVPGTPTGGLSSAAAFSNAMVLRVNLFGTPADINADRKSDLLWRNSSTGQIWRLFMNGFASSGGALVYAEPNLAWKVVGGADFNADGIGDLLWRNDSTGQVFLLMFNTSGFVASGGFVTTEPNPAWKIVHTPDLDGDGRADIVWWNSATGQVYAMLMNGSTITAQGFVYVEPNTAWKIVATGDFAGGGKSNQLLWRNSSTGQVYLMTVGYSAGVFSQSGAQIYQEPNTAWKILAAADFDGNGRSDILWRNDSTGQVFVMLMDGGAVASEAMVYTEPNLAWKIVAQGDYNGDGKADLLWRNESTGQVWLMLMNGLGIASQGLVYTEPNTAWKILGPWEYGQ